MSGRMGRQAWRTTPLLAELVRLRHFRQEAFLSEWFAEIAEIARSRRLLHEARAGRDVCWIEGDDQTEPLVTIRIATRDRPELLRDRSVAAALSQTYDRIEVLVVGDGCGPETERALRGVDPRIRYINLPRSGRYPTDPIRRWRVAGVKPMDVAIELAAGEWIAPCDDDDEFTPTHVEHLLGFAKRDRHEFVWSLSDEIDPITGHATVRGLPDLQRGATTHGAILYSLGLAFIRYSHTADRMREPADWNLIRRMALAGANMAFLDEITYRYFIAGPTQYEPKAEP